MLGLKPTCKYRRPNRFGLTKPLVESAAKNYCAAKITTNTWYGLVSITTWICYRCDFITLGECEWTLFKSLEE
jgi:hypothetical protein